MPIQGERATFIRHWLIILQSTPALQIFFQPRFPDTILLKSKLYAECYGLCCAYIDCVSACHKPTPASHMPHVWVHRASVSYASVDQAQPSGVTCQYNKDWTQSSRIEPNLVATFTQRVCTLHTRISFATSLEG